MTTQGDLSRRSLLKRAALAGAAIAGASAYAVPFARSVFAQNGDFELRCTSDGVRVRDNPGLATNVRGYVNTGDVVNQIGDAVNADGYAWLPISVQRDRNLTGWAAADFFEPAGTAGWVAGTRVHVTSDDVNLRSGPGLGNGVLATFDTNTNGAIVGGPQSADGYSWYSIGIGGLQGWMVANYLAEGHVGATTFPAGAWVWTTSDVNLRSGAGVGRSIIAVYGAQEAGTVIAGPQAADGYSWYQIEMARDGNVGWMAGEFLAYAPTEPTGQRRRVFDGPLNLRDSPDTSANLVTTLATGEVVVIRDASFVVNDGYTWASVYVERNPALIGWVASDFTEAI